MKKRLLKKQIKLRLAKYRADLSDNIIPLNDDDFEDNGRLLSSSYENIKELTKHLDKKMYLKITLPKKYEKGFLPILDQYITLDILFLEKEVKNIKLISFLLLFTAIVTSITYHYMVETSIFYEMSVVAFWVFVWGAIDRLFFDLPKLRKEESRLLQIAGAEIESVE